MPLSEQEQRLLDEMERSLYHSAGDDVTTVGRRGKANYTAIVIGVLAGVVGVALLIVGVVVRLPAVGLVGFAVMFAGALFAVAPPRRFTVAREVTVDAGSPRRPTFMDSLNERWEKRDEER